MNYDMTDIAFYSRDLKREGDYDLETKVAADGTTSTDFRLTDHYESARQDATNRIRTQKTDWRSHPLIGADLELFLGEPNVRETGDKVSMNIRNTLIYDDHFSDVDLSIRSVPTGTYKLENFTLITTNDADEILLHTPIDL